MVDDENRKKKNSAELSMIHSIIGQYNGGINLVINPDAIWYWELGHGWDINAHRCPRKKGKQGRRKK